MILFEIPILYITLLFSVEFPLSHFITGEENRLYPSKNQLQCSDVNMFTFTYVIILLHIRK